MKVGTSRPRRVRMKRPMRERRERAPGSWKPMLTPIKSRPMQALEIHAGARALKHLREYGLRASDVRAIPAAAGGPKGLILNPLDRFVFGRWLATSTHT